MSRFIIFASACTVILIGILTGLSLTEDRSGPVITVTADQVTYTQGDDPKDLLRYATAMDDRDGDVTQSILVSDILPMLDSSLAKVIYIAEDNSNNITKEDVYVTYNPLETENNLKGATSSGYSGEETQTENSIENKTLQKTELRELNGNIEKEDTTGNPSITLKVSEFVISRGNSFDPLERIEEVKDDRDLENYLLDHATIKGSYDVNTRGDYVLLYYVTDSEGNESNKVYLLLKVE